MENGENILIRENIEYIMRKYRKRKNLLRERRRKEILELCQFVFSSSSPENRSASVDEIESKIEEKNGIDWERVLKMCESESRVFISLHYHVLHLHRDFVQEAFIESMKSLDRYDHRRSEFYTFVNSRMKFAIIDHYRKYLHWNRYLKKSHERIDIDEIIETKTELYHGISYDGLEKRFLDKDHIAKLMERLSARERYIIHSLYFKEETMEKIAGELDINESRVSQLHSSIIEKIKNIVFLPSIDIV